MRLSKILRLSAPKIHLWICSNDYLSYLNDEKYQISNWTFHYIFFWHILLNKSGSKINRKSKSSLKYAKSLPGHRTAVLYKSLWISGCSWRSFFAIFIPNKTEHAVQPQRRREGWNNLHEFLMTKRLTDGQTDRLKDWQTYRQTPHTDRQTDQKSWNFYDDNDNNNYDI